MRPFSLLNPITPRENNNNNNNNNNTSNNSISSYSPTNTNDFNSSFDNLSLLSGSMGQNSLCSSPQQFGQRQHQQFIRPKTAANMKSSGFSKSNSLTSIHNNNNTSRDNTRPHTAASRTTFTRSNTANTMKSVKSVQSTSSSTMTSSRQNYSKAPKKQPKDNKVEVKLTQGGY